MKTKEANVTQSPSGRVTRTPVGRRNVLTVNGKDPDFEYRIANDDGDNIERLMAAGYVIEDAEKVTVGDHRIQKVAPPGSKAEVSVGMGMKAYVMKQKKEYFLEDQAAKQAEIRKLEDSSKKNALSGTDYGDLRTDPVR